MKTHTKMISLAALAVLSVMLISGTVKTAATTASEAAAPAPRPGKPSTVVSPEIPVAMDFCGQRVSLDRSDIWERFDRELTSMMYTHGSTLLTFKRANKYFPVMAPILKANNVPADVIYLACVESTLDPLAYSGAGAAGMWQFLESTAKQYGLEVNGEVDERYHIEKATAAACRYLNAALRRYGNWESVMASYNAGMGRIDRELEAQSAKSAFDLYLNKETSRYVFRIMATKAIMENPSTFGFDISSEQLYQPQEYTEATVTGAIDSWSDWARSHGITYAQLREANPWIRDKKLTNRAGRTYTVKIPAQKSLYRSTAGVKVYDDRWTR